MSAPKPTGANADRAPSDSTLIEFLDALASGRIDCATFLTSMREPIGRPDETGNWEVLSLVDQYYRRGKLSKELFHQLRIGLGQFALGMHGDDFPPPRAAARAAATPRPKQPVTKVDIPPTVQPESVIVTAPAGPREARPDSRKSVAPEAAREIRVGDVLRNRYRIIGVLGQGGMGTVYEADDNYRLDIPPNGQGLAIKVLHTSVTKRAELFSELRREFQHLQTLSHPNIVRAYEFDRDGPIAFFTMELLNGSLLSQVLLARNRIRLESANAWTIVRDVGGAIAHAHSRNVVHGDINPQNIFITQRGNVRVLDFGASHATPRAGSTGEAQAASFATPGYASCQVLEGARPDTRDDVFALACVTYLLLGGEHPFKSHTALEARVRGIKPKRPAGLNGRQWRALRAGLQWNRDKRPSDVAEWLQALDLPATSQRLPPLADLTVNPRPPGRRWSFAFAIGLFVLLLAAGFWVTRNRDEISARIFSRPLPSVPEPSADSINREIQTTPPSAVAPAARPMASPLPAPASVAALPRQGPPTTSIQMAPALLPAAATQPALTKPTAAHSTVSQIELAADTVDVPPDEPSASVLVHRKGNLHGRAGFSWWTESGTAKPVADFASVAPHVEYFEDGKSTLTLSIRLTDAPHVQDKSFYVVIDQPEEGATLGPRALTMVTLPGSQSTQ